MIPYAEFYNYDRLESAAVELGLLNTEADEENIPQRRTPRWLIFSKKES